MNDNELYKRVIKMRGKKRVCIATEERNEQSVLRVTMEPGLYVCLYVLENRIYACGENIITNEKGAFCFSFTTLHSTAIYATGILKKRSFLCLCRNVEYILTRICSSMISIQQQEANKRIFSLFVSFIFSLFIQLIYE